MRYAILIARLHGETKLVAGAVGHPGEIAAEFKRLVVDPPAELAELHLVVSDQGVTKKKRFTAPPEIPAPPSPVEETPASPAPEVGAASSDESPAEADAAPAEAAPAEAEAASAAAEHHETAPRKRR